MLRKLVPLLFLIVVVAKVDASCEQKLIATGHVRNIVNSQPNPKAWPWMTAIFNVTSRDYMFSGSLISREHVLIGKHRALITTKQTENFEKS